MKFVVFIALFFADLGQDSPGDQVILLSRCANIAETPDSRVSDRLLIAPGPPPLLSFRLYEGKRHGSFANSDLMLDDAGH